MQMNRYLNSLVLFLFVFAYTAAAQKPFFQIQSVDGKQTIKVKKGQFLQCIRRDSLGQESFIFGEVIAIRRDGVALRDNPFIRGSGGFAYYTEIVNIDKIRILKRSFLSECICGCILGQLSISYPIPKVAIGPISGIATFYLMVRALKRKKKSLFKNRVPEVVILIPPGVKEQNDRYFDSSSLNQPE